MQIEALEYSERDQCFHFNYNTKQSPENTNSYKTIVNNISTEEGRRFVTLVKSVKKIKNNITVAEIKSLFNNNQNI